MAEKLAELGFRIPHGGTPAVSHMQGARRVGADEFHLHPLIVSDIYGAVCFILRVDGFQ